jgi:hypothetical protein
MRIPFATSAVVFTLLALPVLAPAGSGGTSGRWSSNWLRLLVNRCRKRSLLGLPTRRTASGTAPAAADAAVSD